MCVCRYEAVGYCGPFPQWLNSVACDRGSLFLDAVRKAVKERTLLGSDRASLRVGYIAASKSFLTTAWRVLGLVPRILVSDEEVDVLELLDLCLDTVRSTLVQPSVDFGMLGLVCRCIVQFCGVSWVRRDDFYPNVFYDASSV